MPITKTVQINFLIDKIAILHLHIKHPKGARLDIGHYHLESDGNGGCKVVILKIFLKKEQVKEAIGLYRSI